MWRYGLEHSDTAYETSKSLGVPRYAYLKRVA
jgi:hypothetical protein